MSFTLLINMALPFFVANSYRRLEFDDDLSPITINKSAFLLSSIAFCLLYVASQILLSIIIFGNFSFSLS